MGHFTIKLPNNRLGDVRWGKVRKVALPFGWLFQKDKDVKTGYIIKLSPGIVNQNEYRLFKTKDGRWFHDPDGKKPVEDEASIAIKQAIEQQETFSA
jgi:hypothetical protein